ncbi:MAG: VirB8/TrbF family protein [Pseudomonadota bacterium]
MSTTFNEPPKEFSASTTGASRYTKQLAALEHRAESERNNTKNWRLVALTVSGIAILATAGLIYAASRIPTPAVHLVEIDSKTGEPLRHEVIGEPIEISDAMVSHVIGRWIQWTRSKSIDPIVLRDHWKRAYQFVPVTSKPQIDAYARDIGAFDPAKVGKEAVTVEIVSVTRQSQKTFQVRWQETVFADGHRQGRQRFTANVTVDFLKPTTPRQIQINPLGLMITEIYVQPDVATAESAS